PRHFRHSDANGGDQWCEDERGSVTNAARGVFVNFDPLDIGEIDHVAGQGFSFAFVVNDVIHPHDIEPLRFDFILLYSFSTIVLTSEMKLDLAFSVVSITSS